MGFKEDLQRLSIQVKERKEYITNEEMTKQALIIPFIQILGFDVFNPLEVRPEYIADFGKKKGEKVDYALFKDNEPIIFVEAKSVNENLLNHDAQLARYFNAVTDVKLAVLTNGIEYKFFTDLNANNIMDESPFLNINLLDLKEVDIENLSKIRKEAFDKESFITYAEELVYTSVLNDNIKTLLKNPSDEFIRFIIKDFSETRITSNVIERFRPLVKKAISNAVLDIVSKGLYQDEIASSVKVEVETTQPVEVENDDKISKKKSIITTQDEIKAFEMIKNILEANNKDTVGINYKDTTSYFSIHLNSITKWFIRLNLDATNKNIMVKLPIEKINELCGSFKVDVAPKGIAESRIYINDIKDIECLSDLIIKCYDSLE